MPVSEPAALLREGLLEGARVVLAGAARPDSLGGRFGVAVRAACEGLGASVAECRLADEQDAAAQEQAIDASVQAALERLGGASALVVDGASLFAAGEGRQALYSTLQGSWSVVRALTNAAFLPDERGGRVFLLAPPAGAGEQSEGARAGLENLARTLSIEWARYGVTVLTVAPGADTEPGEVGTLVAYLASPAGSYFSGCLLDLRGTG